MKNTAMTDRELRELDAWIAFNIIGITTELVKIRDPDISFFPNYSTDPAAAMDVMQKCAESFTLCIAKRADGWMVSDVRKIRGYSKTLELAICLAAKELFAEQVLHANPFRSNPL